MNRDSRIYVAGHEGLVGSALMRCLAREGYENLIFRSRSQLDLRCQVEVDKFFVDERPDYVFLSAAKVGGIWANDKYPADFIRDNLAIQNNVLDAAYRCGVKKLLFLGSSCIYPKLCPQPIKEEYLLSGPLEPTNQAYAIAKISGVIMCQAYNKQHHTNFICAMPTNLYGPNDNFDLDSSHVLPALLRKFHEAKISQAPSVTVWGTGNPCREFLHVDDLASACLFLMRCYSGIAPVNVGTGVDISISQLASIICRIVRYQGQIIYDTTKPDGTPKKLLDISKLKTLGWSPSIGLEDGIRQAYSWYVSTIEHSKHQI